jgi:hypothetical protein
MCTGMQIKVMRVLQIMKAMQSNDLLKSNENSEDNAKVTAYMIYCTCTCTRIIIPSSNLTTFAAT